MFSINTYDRVLSSPILTTTLNVPEFRACIFYTTDHLNVNHRLSYLAKAREKMPALSLP